ncbi:MAG: UbiA family prenyltransferase [Deltaproteobacteria bacterium]|nr:UbiA family prenyltransferase [Deltaproteobacteria bacterium]
MADKSVITCDLEGRIETFNRGAAALFGWTPEEVVGKKRVSLFSPGLVVLEHVPRWLKGAVAAGSFETDTVFVRKDGAEFPAHIRVSPTRKRGQHVGYCGVTHALPPDRIEGARPRISLGTHVFAALVVTRAPFLTATLVPALLGGALAAASGRWSVTSFLLALTGALALHVAANTWNDLFDWRSGTDQGNNDYFLPFSGGSRAIELGLVGERGLARIAWSATAVAGGCGVALVARGATLWLLLLGGLGALLAYVYTAPPLRLAARRGLGELSVGLAFGPLLVGGVFVASSAAQLSDLRSFFDAVWAPALSGVPLGLLTANILLVNEIPDAPSDARAGKNTLVVTHGARAARALYGLSLVGALAAHGLLVLGGWLPRGSLVALLALPFAARAWRTLSRHLGERALVGANRDTIYLHLVYGALLVGGTALGR